MAVFRPKFVDLVRNVTVVEGTGPAMPGAAVSGFTGLAEALQPGDQFYYCIQGIEKPAEREVGRGTVRSDGSIARAPIDGTLTNFTTGTKTISLVAAAEWFERIEQSGAAGGGGSSSAADRAALAAMPADGPVVLGEAGREGIFRFDSADHSAKVASDPLQGIYVAPEFDPSGAAGAWVRSGTVLTPHMLGAVESRKTGDRLTGTPFYFEYQVDATAEIQALFDLVKAETDKAWDVDLSGFWSLKDHDGDGYCILIDQPYWLVRTFRMGHFAVMSEEHGEAVFKISGACFNHRTTGRWEIWGGPNMDADAYDKRTFKHAIEARTISLWDIESLYCRAFRKWAVFMPASPVDANFNQNIGAKFGRLKVNNCGSVPNRSGLRLSSGYSGGIRTGTGNSLAQRSVIKLDLAGAAAEFDVADDDWVVINGEPYQVMAVDTAANKLSIFPWLPPGQEASGTLHGMFGGALHVAGSDTARVKVELLDTIGCGIGIYSRGLYGMSVHDAMIQSGGASMILGTEGGNTIGNQVLGAHWEANLFDLISRNETGSQTFISGAVMGQDDQVDPFKLCRSIAANDGTGLNRATAFPSVTFNLNGVDYHSADGPTKSRAYSPILSNDPRWRRIEKVADAMAITLKYIEPVDRFFRQHFTADLTVVGLSGGAPAGEISIALDPADAAAGVTMDGGAGPYIVPAGAASGVVRLHFVLDTLGTSRNWRVLPVSGLPATSLSAVDATLSGVLQVGSATRRIRMLEAGSNLYLQAGTVGASTANGNFFFTGYNGQELTSFNVNAEQHGFYAGGTMRLYVYGAGVTLVGAALVNGTLGYGGAGGIGGSVTQAGGKAAAVTLDKVCGQVTMDAAALPAGASVGFTLNCSKIAATDTVIVNIAGGAADSSAYGVSVGRMAAGSCDIVVRNGSGGALSEALLLNFAVLKAVAA